MALQFDTAFDPEYGRPVAVAPGVKRLTANNPGPFTFAGTNTYLVGDDSLAVIDPGPDDPAHLESIVAATGHAEITHIVVTHTHRDHSPGARPLQERTGAIIVGAAAHRAARPLFIGEVNHLDASADPQHRPDVELKHGGRVSGREWTLEAIATPGHTANHLAFALRGEGLVFSGDHVMAWATTIVAPPDGSMGDYMASLDLLLSRPEHVYLPGHGGRIADGPALVRGLKAHRRMRERAILARLEKGDRTVPQIVAEVYRDTDRRLHGAAALSTLAHLEDLVARGLVVTHGPPAIDKAYELASVS